MKLLLIFAIASIATADKLEDVYHPSEMRSSRDASTRLKTSLESSQQNQTISVQLKHGSSSASASASATTSGSASASSSATTSGSGSASSSASASASANAKILRFDNEITENGYHYFYETSDGTKAEQEGHIFPLAIPEKGSLQVSGSFSYIGDNEQTYSITYTADENGYNAEGTHLPTSPFTLGSILRSLELTSDDSRGEDLYSSQKTSYDADAAGYKIL